MNIKTSRIFYGSLIVVFITIISLSIYYLLGGYNEMKLYRAEPENRVLFGKFFDTVHDSQFASHGSKCRQMIEEGSINGRLTVMLYPNDSLKDSELDRFVGISTTEEMVEVPSDFEIIEIDLPERIVLEMADMHLLVQPRPDKVEEMIRRFAEVNNLVLADHYLISYSSDHSETLFEWPIQE
jgi:hypothetical protein